MGYIRNRGLEKLNTTQFAQVVYVNLSDSVLYTLLSKPCKTGLVSPNISSVSITSSLNDCK